MRSAPRGSVSSKPHLAELAIKPSLHESLGALHVGTVTSVLSAMLWHTTVGCCCGHCPSLPLGIWAISTGSPCLSSKLPPSLLPAAFFTGPPWPAGASSELAVTARGPGPILAWDVAKRAGEPMTRLLLGAPGWTRLSLGLLLQPPWLATFPFLFCFLGWLSLSSTSP